MAATSTRKTNRSSAPRVARSKQPLPRARISQKQLAARNALLALMAKHNPEPTEDELEAIRNEWREA